MSITAIQTRLAPVAVAITFRASDRHERIKTRRAIPQTIHNVTTAQIGASRPLDAYNQVAVANRATPPQRIAPPAGVSGSDNGTSVAGLTLVSEAFTISTPTRARAVYVRCLRRLQSRKSPASAPLKLRAALDVEFQNVSVFDHVVPSDLLAFDPGAVPQPSEVH